MPRYADNGVRITRWERDESEGWLLNIAGPRDLFEDALNQMKMLLAPWERLWLPSEKCWWVSASAAETLALEWEPLRRFLAGEQQRQQQQQGAAHDRHDHHDHHDGEKTKQHQSRRRTSSSTSAARIPARVAQAFDTLCLTVDAPPELVAAARRTWARIHHPDRAGGDHMRMVAINNAADLAESWLAEHQHSASA